MTSLHPFTPRTVRVLGALFGALLVGTTVAEYFIHRHVVFGVDGIFGFNAWYGFASSVVLIALSRLLGFVLKRPDTYYDR